MKISDVLQNVHLLYVETAPFIYFVEKYPVYIERMHSIFQYVSSGRLEIATSVITLTETLTKPLREGDKALENDYRELLLNTYSVRVVSINAAIANRAAELRAQYNMKTPDALQVAAAIEMNCNAFLTNDAGIKRIKSIEILMIDELEADVSSTESE